MALSGTHHQGEETMRVIQTIQASTLCLIFITVMATAAAAGDKEGSPDQVTPLDKKTADRARYIIKTAGCNDCHTTGYAEAAGKIPERDWLKGDAMGWRGPWGTTYASNLRLYMQKLSEAQWIKVSRSIEFRPPMPWFVLREMTEQDLSHLSVHQKSGAGRRTGTRLSSAGSGTEGPLYFVPFDSGAT